MGYLEDKQRNGRLTPAEHDELLALFNASLDAAVELRKALCWSGNDAEVVAAEDADDRAYRAVLVWLCSHTLPETPTTAGAPSTGPEVAP